jgi:hypothetical protein
VFLERPCKLRNGKEAAHPIFGGRGASGACSGRGDASNSPVMWRQLQLAARMGRPLGSAVGDGPAWARREGACQSSGSPT